MLVEFGAGYHHRQTALDFGATDRDFRVNPFMLCSDKESSPLAQFDDGFHGLALDGPGHGRFCDAGDAFVIRLAQLHGSSRMCSKTSCPPWLADRHQPASASVFRSNPMRTALLPQWSGIAEPACHSSTELDRGSGWADRSALASSHRVSWPKRMF